MPLLQAYPRPIAPVAGILAPGFRALKSPLLQRASILYALIGMTRITRLHFPISTIAR